MLRTALAITFTLLAVAPEPARAEEPCPRPSLRAGSVAPGWDRTRSSPRNWPPSARPRIEVFDAIGHLVPLEAKQHFNNAMLKFLDAER